VLLSLIAVSVVLAGWALGGRRLERSRLTAPELELLDDIGFLLSAVMWFVFGAASVLALAAGVSWAMVLFCLLAFNVLSGPSESAALLTMVVAVLGSVVLHGVGAPAAARAYRWPQTKLIA
jgi:hypothetical protein